MSQNLDVKITEVAERVKGLRLDMNMTCAQMAKAVDLTEEEYMRFEEGKEDFNFTFIYKVATLANVELSEIMEGSSPSLTSYTVTRKGEGRPISRRNSIL